MAYTQLGDSVFFRPPTLEDLHVIYEIEVQGYPADEAATLEKLQYRIAHGVVVAHS